MNNQRGVISREELIDIIRVRNDFASRFKSIDPELIDAEIAALALNGGMRGDELRLAMERFIKSLHNI